MIRSRSGFTVVEFVLAMTLLALVFVSSAEALTAASTSLAKGHARTSAALVAYNTLEKARALNCGMGVDPSTAATLAEHCYAAFGGDSAHHTSGMTSPPSSTDDSFTTLQDGRSFQVTLTTLWRSPATPAASCSSSPTTFSSQPLSLVRTALVSWTIQNQHFSRTFQTIQTISPDDSKYPALTSGGVLVTSTAPATTPQVIRLTLPNGTYVEHTLVSVAPSMSCAWFPYVPIPLGSSSVKATLSSNGTTLPTVSIAPGATQVVAG